MKKYILLGLVIILAAILRLYHLGSSPPSLYWDEVSLGYNAFSISETARDEHGEFLPYSRFIAFGDYKPPVYIYAIVPFVKVLGLNETTVRLPSAIAGIFLVIVAYLLCGELLLLWDTKPRSLFIKSWPLLTALLVTISPWSLSMSRVAFESNFATSLTALGLVLFLKGIRTRSLIILATSMVCFSLSIYTFNSPRMFVPIIIAVLSLIFIRELIKLKVKYILALILFVILLLPAAPHLLSREGSLRFQEVSWVNDLAPITQANSRVAVDGGAWWANVVHNRRFVYLKEFLKHYFDHLNPKFLFVSGDVNPKLSSQSTGELYWWDLPFLLGGIYFLASKRRSFKVVAAWMAISLIPASLARETPHALRTLEILPMPQVLAGLGIVYFLDLISRKGKLVLISLVAVLYFVSLSYYVFNYYHSYQINYALDWEYGYKDMVNYVRSIENKYDFVSVTNKYGRPYIYFLFYEKYPPSLYWVNRKIDRDWYGFWYVHSFGKYVFDGPIPRGKGLFVRGADETPQGIKILKSIYSPKGEVIFNVYDT